MSEHKTPAPNDVDRDTSSAANATPNDPAVRPDSNDPTTAEGNRFSPDFKSEPEVDPSTSADDEETDADIDTTGG
ncbi:hypothetical protein [Pseudomonas sp. PS01301]|uniref:hypothetical protein n=1 Tax=Pseudomonas sp. PS01301 TaxID=2991437 RepID=UPI00249ACEF1|nr:hypothetical protein [Pseudomonas sp. PS01301]